MAQVTVFAQTTEFFNCDVIEVADGGVTVRHKKPRSSKMLISTFPTSKVLYVQPGDDGEMNGELLVQGRFPVVSFEGEVAVADGVITVTTTEGAEVTLMSHTDVEISEEADEDEAPAKAKGKGKAAAAKSAPAKGKAKAKAEPEEEEEEEEEEEAPKAKKGKAAPVKGKAKAKAEPEEEEEEEEEEEAPKAKKGAKAKGKAKDDDGEEW